MKAVVRAVALGVILVASTGQAPPAPAGEIGDFCARLAKNVGVEDTEVIDGQTVWKANALNFGQRFLFGGTATTSVSAEPMEPVTLEGYKRADGMCAADGKGATCRLVGPINFNFVWKGNRTLTPVLDGETATVSVQGIETHCQSGSAPGA